jgi:hypothetical protein
MASNSKNIAELLNGDVTVTATDIADGAVSTAKIADDAVTVAKVADQVIGRKNLIINGEMKVAQRGTSFTTIDGYGLDRWRAGTYTGTGGDVDVSQGSFTPAASYPERFGNYIQYTINTMPSSANPNLHQRIEDVATANGQEVTLSFWAKVTSGTYTMRSFFTNNSGGSGGTTTPVEHSLTTTWTKFTNTSTLPSVTSGTVGSTTFLRTDFDFPNTQSGATIQITGVQLEVGDTATPFEHRSYGEELALCERYFQVLADHDNSSLGQFMALAHTTTIARAFIQLRTQMRAAPSIDTNSSISNSWRWTGAGQNKYNNTIDFHSSSPTFFGVTNPDGTFSVGALHLFTNATGAYLYAVAEL